MSLIYQTKLKNLFAAHQAVYTELLYNNLSEFQKTHLRKLLCLFQRDIKKILSQKNGKYNSNHHNIKRANISSSYFTIDKTKNNLNYHKKSKKTSLVFKKKTLAKYFIKKPHTQRNEWEIMTMNLHDDSSWFKITNYVDQLQIIDKEIVKEQIVQKNSIEENLLDQEVYSDQSSSEEVLKKIPCDGHGKSSDEKNEFIKILGLIHKNDFEMMINCKKSRKRRTTANPQFSHAAIEAKRITKLEIANERKHRRQMALEKQKSEQYFPERHDEYDFFRSQNVFKSENELSPGLYSIMTDLNIEQSCKICSEACRFIEDTIVICQNCLSIFHISCLQHQKVAIFLDDIKCTACNPPSEQQKTKFSGYDALSQKLINLRQYISLLTNANYCLELFFEEKQLEKKELLEGLNELLDKIHRIGNISLTLNNINTSDDDKLDKVQLHSETTNNELHSTISDKVLDLNETTCNKQMINSGSNNSILGQFESNNTNSYSRHSSSSISNTSKCEQEFSIVSSCA